MAKVNAPLFSFNASGKIANALVYFGWKGIDVVRSYVIPANPKTDAQRTQRDYLKLMVQRVHLAQAAAVFALGAIDIAAYRALALIQATPRTWFNQIIQQGVKQLVAEKQPAIFTQAIITEGDTTLTLVLAWQRWGAQAITKADIWYGTSPTAMVHSETAVITGNTMNCTLNTLTNGVKYYWQLRSTEHDDYDGCRSGIYHGTPVKD